MSQHRTQATRFAVYANSDATLPAIDVHAALKSKDMKIEGKNLIVASGKTIDSPIGTPVLNWMDWLPSAAKAYHVSDDPSDYIFVPVVIMPSDLPNRNGVGFPLSELTSFRPDLGRVAYSAWTGMPTHYEHANEDPTKARGIILDSMMRRMKGHGKGRLFKLVQLLSFDRTKDPELVTRILSGDLNTYSMGAWVDSYTCSICGSPPGCPHISLRRPLDFYEHEGKLAYRKVKGITPIETSAVNVPAYTMAASDVKFDLRTA